MADSLPISARTLGSLLLEDFCPRCFWISLHCDEGIPFQLPFPGIFSSIDGYTKGVIHSYFDHHENFPDWFPNIGDVVRYVPSRDLHWSKFTWTDPETKITLRGTPDDIFELRDGSFHIVDYKTAKATETQDVLFPLYEVQLNVYAHLGRILLGFRQIRLSLIYMEPQTHCSAELLPELIFDNGFNLRFCAMLKHVTCQPEEFLARLLRRARTIYDKESAPRGRDGCENCELISAFMTTVAM
jgi:PD-(D/E)XK nuclease superfamily